MFAVLLIPHFRLQAALRFRRELRGRPVAVTEGAKGQILEISPEAREFSVRVGMTSAQGLARCPELVLISRAWPAEGTVQDALLELADSLSPEFEATGEGCITVDLRSARIRDWAEWGRQIVVRLEALELEGKIGVAPNPDLAFLAARRAEPFLVVQAPEVFLSQLALSEIDPPPYLQALLRDWGVHTLGQLTSLPRGDLADRLGPDVDRLWQRASGQTQRLLRLVRPVEEFAEVFDFEHEIETTEPLLFILRRFLEQLTLRLQTRHRVATQMFLVLPVDDGTQHERAFTISSPTDDAETLFRILHTHLETLQLAGHPTGVRLIIEPVLPEHQQLRLFESALRDPNRFGETLARLGALVGAGNVGVAEIENTHRPDAWRMAEPRFHELREERETAASLVLGLPLRRFRPPLAVQVFMNPQGQPGRVMSSTVAGRITGMLGPYRASGGWWERDRWGVEEWDVEIGGQGLYRLRHEAQTWVLEGCYESGLR